MAYLNCNIIAAKVGFPVGTLRRWCRTGKIQALRVGRAYLVDEDNIKQQISDVMAVEANDRQKECLPVYVSPRKARTKAYHMSSPTNRDPLGWVQAAKDELKSKHRNRDENQGAER